LRPQPRSTRFLGCSDQSSAHTAPFLAGWSNIWAVPRWVSHPQELEHLGFRCAVLRKRPRRRGKVTAELLDHRAIYGHFAQNHSTRAAMQRPSKCGRSQEILFAVLRFWRERPNGHILRRIDDTRRLFPSHAPFACRREHDQALGHRRLAQKSLPVMTLSLRLIRFELGLPPDFGDPAPLVRAANGRGYLGQASWPEIGTQTNYHHFRKIYF
jgi:hypothetical protein